jgi:HEPN domain-containing protein
MPNYNSDGDYNTNRNIVYNTTVFVNAGSDIPDVREWKEKLLSILKQVPAKADIVKPLIQLIVAAIAPAKIYILHHKEMQGRPNGGYIDLLIIISGKCGVPYTELTPILEMAYLKDARVSCSLHSEGTVLDGLQKGHAFYSLHCIPENLVYDDKRIPFPVTSQEIIIQLKQHLRQTFTSYFNKAVDFYESAVLLQQKQVSPITIFMLHQAAEMAYRSILQSLNGYDKRTHEIRVLKKFIRRCAPQLGDIFPADTGKEKRLLELLDSAYLNTRYNENFTISEEELTILFERIHLLHETTQKVFEETVDPFEKQVT